MEITPYQGDEILPEKPERIDDPEKAADEFERLLMSGTVSVAKAPFTLGEFINAIDENGKLPHMTPETISDGLKKLYERGLLGFDDKEGEYHLKELA